MGQLDILEKKYTTQAHYALHTLSCAVLEGHKVLLISSGVCVELFFVTIYRYSMLYHELIA